MTTAAATAAEIVPLESQRAAGAALARAIRERHTFLALTGECDVGKTIVLDAALAVVTDEALRLIMVGNPRSGPLTLTSVLQQIAQYAPPPSAHAEEGDVERIHAMLQSAEHKRFVIVVEDAESLHPKALSFLQLLPELTGLTRGGVQIVLVGSPGLWRLLEGESFARIREQLTVRIVVEPLSDAEARYFATWRCRDRLERFGPEAASAGMIEALVRYGLGRPGRIDALVDRISLLAPSRGGADASLVVEAAEMLGGFSAMPIAGAAPALAETEPTAPEEQPTDASTTAPVVQRRGRSALIAGLIVVAGVAGWLSYGRLELPWLPRSTKTGIIGRTASAALHDAPAGSASSIPEAAMMSHGPNPLVTRQASAVGVLPEPSPTQQQRPATHVAPNPPPGVPETSTSVAPEPQGGPQPAATSVGPNPPNPAPAGGTAAAPQAGASSTGPTSPPASAPPTAPARTPATPPGAPPAALATPGATTPPASAPPPAKPAGAELANLRKDFDAFLARAGTDTASLPEPQKRALFQQYLAWRSRNKGASPAAGAPAAKAP